MIYQLARVLLAPVLLGQGLYVRRVTPRLPEPEGLRFGTLGTGPKMKILILGDSAAAGVGAGTQKNALSGRLIKALGSSHEVSWKLVAQTGDASSQVIARLRSLPNEVFDTVVVSVGVNDVTSQTGDKEWLHNLESIIELLKSKFHVQHIILSSLPPMHLFPALPQPLRWWLGLRAKKLSNSMESFAGNDKQCTFLSVPFPFEQNLIAVDGFHPGEPAYRLWGEELAKLIRTEVSSLND
ncbi:MAG: SGNH/GDSL hydrolase family protein [Proteobacteria bacterium]|nr:SGNH/GDSL hydrolase family protein [Pseudomonadota bacterium]